MRGSKRTIFTQGGIEPSLDELLADPLTIALMRADHVTVEDVRMAACQAVRGKEPSAPRPQARHPI